MTTEHGTYAGFKRHFNTGEPACDDCIAARRKYQRDYDATKRKRRASNHTPNPFPRRATKGRAPLRVGDIFGQLTIVVAQRSGEPHVRCRCTCGKTKTVAIRALRAGMTKSCGCLRSRMAAASRTTHGMTGTTEHRIWKGMLRRCLRRNCKSYRNYGGRDITVCDRWRDFANFYADMGPRPEGKTLDRVDNDGPYSPENCRWATGSEQALNRRARKLADACGKGHPFTPENTYREPAGRGGRRCRTCASAARSRPLAAKGVSR